MNIGDCFTLAWKHPHRIECEVIALEADHVVVRADHRCGFDCEIKAMSNTLPLEGEMRYRYADFAKLFVPLNPDAIALPAANRQLSI